MLGLVALTALALYAVRVSAPPDLMDNDQLKPAHYVHDVVVNGRWVVQTDASGDIASKPPLQVWIASVASLPFGRAHWWTLALPSILGVLVVCAVSAWFARALAPELRYAPLLAGLGVLVSITGEKQVALVRTDALFGATVALTAMLGYLAARGRVSWVWFWLGAALATPTKGPLGLVIASLGLVARPGRDIAQRAPAARLALHHAIGVILFLALAGGWFLAAYLDAGQAFIDKVLGRELVGHAVSSHRGAPPLSNAYKSPGYFLWYYAPASVLALLAVVDLWRTDANRRTLRFLAFWMLIGLTLFAIAPHQRPDHLTVIWAPMAALGAVWVARRIDVWPARRAGALATALALVLVASSYAHRHHIAPQKEKAGRARAVEALADRLESSGWAPFVRRYEGPSYLEYELGRMELALDAPGALELLAGDGPGAVTVRDDDGGLLAMCAQRGVTLYEVERAEAGGLVVTVYANAPTPE